MQGAPTRYVSVSELYSTDEVELLLDEIRELEPTSCRGEDVQDFEIAGSGCAGGGRSPAGTELTEHSWDSHAQYSRAPPRCARALAPLYCRITHLISVHGVLALVLVACSTGACACGWAAAGLRVRVPLPGRVRALLLGAFSSVLLHTVLLAARVTGLRALLPLDWNALELGTALWSAVSLSCGGGLTLHAVLAAPEYRVAAHPLLDLLCSSAALALAGAVVAVALAVHCGLARVRRRSEYRAVPLAPPAPSVPIAAPAHLVPFAGPSTSRDDPL